MFPVTKEFQDKIVTLAEFQKKKEDIKNKRIVLVGGCFDLLHFGHLIFLEKASKEAEVLIVALEPDKAIIESKKRKPIHSQHQRAKILSSLRIVDFVIILPFFKNDSEYFSLVQKIKPYVIAVSGGDPQLTNKTRQAKEVGAKIRIVTPFIKKFSTTNIISYATFSSY